MAGEAEKSLKELKNEITCGICKKHFTADPKVLNCLHCYCKDCILSLQPKDSPGESITCPQCKYKTTLPSGDVNELKTVYFINRLKTKAERQRNAMEAKCELCTEDSDATAEKFCLDCDKFICTKCVEQHSNWKTHSKHEMSSLDDLRKDRVDSISMKEPPTLTCHIHQEQSLNFYCYDCKKCICRLCSMEKEDHEHHPYDKNHILASKVKEKFKIELDHMTELLLKLKNASREIQMMQHDIKTQEESNIQQICAAFGELNQILRNHQQTLVSRAKELAQDKIDKILFQENSLSQAFAKVQHLKDFTELCMIHSVDNELMSIHDTIEQRIEEVWIEQKGIEKVLKPRPQEEIVVEVACADDLQKLCSAKAFVAEHCEENSVKIVDEIMPMVECENCHNLMCRKKAFWISARSPEIICPKCAIECNVVHLDSSTVIKPPNVRCPDHNQETLIYYCLECKSSICNQCQSGKGEHKDHKLEHLETAATEERNKLRNINRLPELHLKLKERLNKVHAIEQKLKKNEKSAISSLRNSYTQLHEILSKSEQKFVEKIQIITYEIVQKLLVPENDLSRIEQRVLTIANFTKECVDHSSDADIIRLHARLTERIMNELYENYTIQVLDDDIKLVERAGVGLVLPRAEALDHFCQTHTLIVKKFDPLVFMTTSQVGIDVPFKAALVTKLANSEPDKKIYKVSSKVESLVDEVVRDCSIKDEGSGRYNVCFTPTVRGIHRLTILVEDQHVSGSPFSIFVSASLNSLTEPIRVWNNINKPFGGTLTSRHDVLCIENSKGIVKLTSDGQLNVLVEDCKLKNLSSIACDNEDNIYGVDELSTNIFTCDRNGDNIQVHEVELTNGKGRVALLILHNELITIDSGESHDTLCVYTREFTLLRETQLTFKVGDLSNDTRGNIYATDSDNCCVNVFNKTGDKLQTLNFDKEHIQYPCGICIFNQQVYLTDCGKHGVLVFTTDGTFLTSIGGELPEEPKKILVDANGFLYVFDCLNNIILCY